MTVTELREQREDGGCVQLVDVRTAFEFAAGHIPGAVNVPMDQIERRLGDLHPNTPAVLVCQSGQRAALTCELLRGRLAAVEVLNGGTNAWINAGLPTIASTSARWALDRQMRLVAGLLTLLGTILALTVDPAWIYLSAIIGAGLTFSAITNTCPMTSCLTRMPWNQVRRPSTA